MKIIIYNPHTKEWNEFINSLGCNEEERNKAINAHIDEIGQEISAPEFVNNSHIYGDLFGKWRYKFIGEPNNLLEKTVKFVYDGSSYIHMKKSFPEYFIDSRTDWYDMINYADKMADFIKEIMEDLANTKVS